MSDLFQQGIIISASRRTDIPRYYSEWLIKRIEEKFVLVRNPFNPGQIKRVSLAPEDVTAIVFWTRDATPLEKYFEKLHEHYRMVFLWTITPYGSPLEPAALPLKSAIDRFIRLSERAGPEKIVWRYDPIIITDQFTPKWHVEMFKKISTALAGHTRRVITSFMTPYSSVVKRFEKAGIKFERSPLQRPDVGDMLVNLSEIAHQNGMEIQACCQEGKLAPYGIPDGACIDANWLAKVFDIPLVFQKDRGQRPRCLCTRSVDIGSYDTCPAGCLYCYGLKSIRRAQHFFATFDQNSPGLWLSKT